MSTALQDRIGSPLDVARRRGTGPVGTIVLWLAASLTAVFFAVLESSTAVLNDFWIPRGNDSFYHARRILDAAVGTRGFYQFDDRLHVPDGAWISWPWAYDYLMAKATQIALWIAPSLNPMAFISYVPVAWIFVNAALFLAAARAIGLSREMQALAMLCFAISPFTQLLHWIAMIDHHYVEYMFVLLCAWLGLRWFKQPEDRRRAIALGATLGVATAFHNGMFVLQLFPLVTAFILWLRGLAPPAAALRSFGLTLVAATLLVLLPSEPFRKGMFEFGLHSWFHLYVAACTATGLAFMSWRPASRQALGTLVALCAALAIPLATQIVSGGSFLSGTFSQLGEILEVRSPYKMFTETMGPVATASYYSWLLLITPVLIALYAYRAIRDPQAERVYFAVFVVLGVTLLLIQMRLHYFGFFGFIVGSLLVVDDLTLRRSWHRGMVFTLSFMAVVLAFQPALHERLFVTYAPSSDPDYAAAMSLFFDLEKLCAEDPGTVLADTNDGSPILFHTECSVIANNFILRPEDEANIAEFNRLVLLTPEEIHRQRPDIKYMLIRAEDFVIQKDGASYLVEHPIVKQLLLDAVPPPGFKMVANINRQFDENAAAVVYARLFRIVE
jgi:hypothetical protein